jgi:hypothetical protein
MSDDALLRLKEENLSLKRTNNEIVDATRR